MISDTLIAFVACVMLALLTACAGPKYLKKRDFSSIVAGAPVTNTKALRKPSLISSVTKGKHKGALLYVYEWDKPKDKIINQMYTYVVVRDDKVEAIYEDPPDKYDRDREAYYNAWSRSEMLREYYRAINAQTAQQIAVGVAAGLAGAGAAMSAAGNSYGPGYYQPGPMYNPGFAGSEGFLQSAPPPTMVPTYAVSRPMATTAIRSGNTLFRSDGTSTIRSGNSFFNSDGTSTVKSGNSYFHSGGGSTIRSGNSYFHSDGTTTTRVGNTFLNSDGSSTTVLGR